MKRAVYENIGGLDERFGIGFFDDDDLAERARRAGFELVVAQDLFIHHFGSRTFQGNGIDAEKLLDENARRFAAKWGLAAANGKRVALRPWSGLPGFFAESQRAFASDVDEGGEEDLAQNRKDAKNANGVDGPMPGERARVTLTMIVRDEQENLANCLESVRGIFDEIVVVDTGSVDRTKEIAREFGAKVFDFVWIDDFAAAARMRRLLSARQGDYAFWLDADDVVEPGEREKLRALLAGLARPSSRSEASPARTEPRPPGENGVAFVVRCACAPGRDGTKGETVVDHVRLFPLRPDVRWTYRVHEQILPSLKRAKVPVRWTDLVVRHTGYADPAVEARKLERNIKILKRDLEERPDDPFVIFNLGASAVEKREWHDSLGFLGRSLAGSAPADFDPTCEDCTRVAKIARTTNLHSSLPSCHFRGKERALRATFVARGGELLRVTAGVSQRFCRLSVRAETESMTSRR